MVTRQWRRSASLIGFHSSRVAPFPRDAACFFIYFIIFINVPNSTGAKTSVRAASLMGSFLSVNALWIRAAHDLEATYFPIKRPRVVRFLIF